MATTGVSGAGSLLACAVTNRDVRRELLRAVGTFGTRRLVQTAIELLDDVAPCQVKTDILTELKELLENLR